MFFLWVVADDATAGAKKRGTWGGGGTEGYKVNLNLSHPECVSKAYLNFGMK